MWWINPYWLRDPKVRVVLPRKSVLPLVVVVLAATGAAVACQSGSTTPTPARTVVLPSATPTPTEKDAVLAVYRAMYPAGRRAEQASPKQRRPILAQVATQPLLDRMLRGITALRATGRVTYGMPVLHEFDVRIDGDRATLHDCQDDRNTGQADDKTGEALLRGTEKVHLIISLRRGMDRAWRVSQMEQSDEPCLSSY
ncbi:hypothetical protein DP939_28350 [Spongiactinospora rosea]|uniref:Lipoprotein n=2 Tax=Spongiactinospora rosea TaxID=2248750 RepID=A0A366LSN3_9ACTN|nr:hypothetical protein DP939_28350 [Spongiactinospora rosea]